MAEYPPMALVEVMEGFGLSLPSQGMLTIFDAVLDSRTISATSGAFTMKFEVRGASNLASSSNTKM